VYHAQWAADALMGEVEPRNGPNYPRNFFPQLLFLSKDNRSDQLIEVKNHNEINRARFLQKFLDFHLEISAGELIKLVDAEFRYFQSKKTSFEIYIRRVQGNN
jgi:hypothetical protein